MVVPGATVASVVPGDVVPGTVVVSAKSVQRK